MASPTAVAGGAPQRLPRRPAPSTGSSSAPPPAASTPPATAPPPAAAPAPRTRAPARSRPSTPRGPRPTTTRSPEVVSSAAGFVLALFVWGWVIMPFVQGGPTQVKKTLMAKFLNKTPDGKWLP